MRITIFDYDNWREIGATLARNKTRTFMTAFGIFWGTAMLAMLLGGVGGLQGFLFRNVAGFATNSAGVFAGQTSVGMHGYNKGMSWAFTRADIAQIRNISNGLDKISGISINRASIVYGTKSSNARIGGVAADFFDIQTVAVDAGRVLNYADENKRAKNIFIGINLCGKLFGADPEYAVGKFVNIDNVAFRIVGVGHQLSDATMIGRVDDMCYMPVTTSNAMYSTGDDVSLIVFSAKAGYKPKEVFKDIRHVVARNHPVNEDDPKAFGEMDISETFESIGKVFTGVDLLAIFVGLGTLIAGIIGVGNIMWIIVRERTTEIGIRRAIGAKPRDIIVQILSESMALTVVAGTTGITFATVVLSVGDMLSADPVLGPAGFQLSFVAAVAIMATFLVLGTIAGVIPAIKAMRIKPVEAMRGK